MISLPMFVTRACSFGILAGILATYGLAAELPELDIAELCKRIARENAAKWSEGPPAQPDFLEFAYRYCLQSEVEAKRDAIWRLRMLREDDQVKCIEHGTTAGTYTAIGQCLDRFTGFLRG